MNMNRVSPLAHAYQVWSTSIYAFMSYLADIRTVRVKKFYTPPPPPPRFSDILFLMGEIFKVKFYTPIVCSYTNTKKYK